MTKEVALKQPWKTFVIVEKTTRKFVTAVTVVVHQGESLMVNVMKGDTVAEEFRPQKGVELEFLPMDKT